MKPKGSEKERNYRFLIIIPILVLLLSAAILVNHYIQTGDWFERSVELKGGTLITFSTDKPVNTQELKEKLSPIGDVVVKELRSFSGYKVSVEIGPDADVKKARSLIEEAGFDTSDASIETIGPALGESFWYQAQISITIAFILMGIIVFIIFRTFVPSTAVMLAAVSDILTTLAIMQVLGIAMSLASFAAILMLIGYSIDTDILLTTRTLKNEDIPIPERIKSAFKTGMTMTSTTLAALVMVILVTTSGVLFEIASVLIIGLLIDIINTWLQNATILRMYAERRGI